MTAIDMSANARAAGPAGARHPASVELSALLNTPAGRKLKEAAGEFEAMLLASLWKSMKSSISDTGEEESDPAHQSLEDWGIQTMSSAIGKAGGFGIGDMILKHLAPRLAGPETGSREPLGKPPVFFVGATPGAKPGR